MLGRTSVSAGRMLRVRQPHLQQCRLPLRNRPTQFSSLPARRFQSTTSSSSTSSSSGGSAFIGGLAGGSTVFLLAYIWYSFSGAKTIVNASAKTQKYFDTAKQKVASTADNLEPNEALNWLRSTALTYSAFIPGAKGYVNTAFDDLDKIRAKHGDEVDAAVRDAYGELKQVVTSRKSGMTYETASKVWDILARFADRVGNLAGDAAQDILNNHPQLKEKLGGSVDQLKQMSENYGPQVKEEVDKTWKQLSDVVKKGASGNMTEAADKAYKILDEKVKVVRGMVDEAWKKGMEQAKPYLDKNPKIKKIIEENKEALQQGDFSQLWDTAKQAAESGDTDKLEKMVKDKVQQAKESGGVLGKGAESLQGGLDKLLQAFPGGAEIAPKLQTLQQIADKRGKEAERILKETVEEIQQVLKKRVGEAEEVADKAKKDAK